MYHFQKSTISKGASYKYILFKNKTQLRYSDFIACLQHDENFRSFFMDLLSNVAFRAYQWETPPVTSSTREKLFEFVIHDRPAIDLPPDPDTFRSYFNESEDPVAVFYNLGGDAKLIAPKPFRKLNYSHIGVFTDQAPIEQQQALWQTVGEEVTASITEEPLWLNTAGGGVAWLHVRLDSRPKYYRHRPYVKGG